ncbi:MAG: GNAT family N-acetyltransferase [Proteobacteria bacterium]|nr:GNAT family N-acetyltransferase [SAR86 cluster bacterium]MDA0344408.1 GNAT family N-acetyltransferase [Pseudomonadota bacterium]MDA0899428.1 GNAT family N-acetyltransferase [Pseudomonadota bacterium]
MPHLNELIILKNFSDLSNSELYKILELRIEVFTVEQDCAYQDLDDKDKDCQHLWLEDNGEILSYVRINPPGIRFPEPSLGRIVTKANARQKGHAETLIIKGLEIIKADYAMPTKISAQSYLENYYSKFGFVKCSEEYLEDNIPHIEMIKDA